MGRNDTITKALDGVADGKTQVMVMGYPTWGAECMHVSVYSVSLTSEVNKVLTAGGDYFPWKVLA